MSAPRGLVVALLAAAPAFAQAPSPTEWRPALYLFGSSERGSGAAYAPPHERLGRDDAASVALGLDARRQVSGGRLEASVFGLAHDPLSRVDRGFYLAARARGGFSWAEGDWRLRFEDSPRLQRRETAGLSDFQRNEAWIELERRLSALGLGLRVGDRRRSLPDDRRQGFQRQALSAFVTGRLGAGYAWRAEGGPQRFDTDTASGWRLMLGLEASAALQSLSAALRLGWSEPLSDGPGGGRLATAPSSPGPSPTPEPVTPPVPMPAPPPSGADAYLSFSPPPPGLLGPGLVVDPLDSDEGDWDFGRRKQTLAVLVSPRLGRSLALNLELHAYRERGPDLAASWAGPVRRNRIAVRATLRRDLGKRTSLLAQGGWQRVQDNRSGLGFSRGIVCLGLELRP